MLDCVRVSREMLVAVTAAWRVERLRVDQRSIVVPRKLAALIPDGLEGCCSVPGGFGRCASFPRGIQTSIYLLGHACWVPTIRRA